MIIDSWQFGQCLLTQLSDTWRAKCPTAESAIIDQFGLCLKLPAVSGHMTFKVSRRLPAW
jgi:hypothetical protein